MTRAGRCADGRVRGVARDLRIGNCSGFAGDRFAAMREMLEGGDLDVLTGDYLAELTMLVLWRAAGRQPDLGYSTTFVRQLEDCLGLAWEAGVRIVANAGGLNPAGCATAVREVATQLGLRVAVAHVAGDDLLPRRDALRAAGWPLPDATLTANTYLGGWGIAAALDAGAQVVVTGRVTDAALVIGPAAWWHGWARDDYDALAGALAAGHILECGAQATGGNYSFFTEVPGMAYVGFPLAEISGDGTAVITKHPGTGGLVDVGTVTAQLLYETQAPMYLNPDVVADFGTIELTDLGENRVRVAGTSHRGTVRGTAPPDTAKVAVNVRGGYRNSMTFLLTGLDPQAKADLVRQQLAPALDDTAQVEWSLERTDREDADTNEQAVARLTVTVKDADPERIGRAFSNAATELTLASYPGAFLAGPPAEATEYGVFQAMYLPNALVEHRAVTEEGTVVDELVNPGTTVRSPHLSLRRPPDPPRDWGPIWRVPLGSIVGARSGDKGGDANLGLWVRTDAAYRWLAHSIDVDCIKWLLPETEPLKVTRHDLPNLRALNFVIEGLLGNGVASSSRLDPQAKGLSEWLRSRLFDVPIALIED
jgi:Acyclic terpene utilisation family protein AtuA